MPSCGWEIKKLRALLGNKGYIRGPFGSALRRGELKDFGIPVYEQQNAIYNHREFRFFIDEDKYKQMSRFTVVANDLIISCSGTVGKVSLIKDNDPIGIISQALLILRPDVTIVLPDFLKYFFQSYVGYNSIVSRSFGAVQVNIAKRDVIEDIEIPLPGISAQKLIVSILSTYDDLIENNERRIKILEEMAQSIYREWFVNYRFPGHENSRMVDSELGEIPEGWNLTTLDDLGLLARGKSKFRPRNDPSLFGGSYPFIQTADVKASSTYITRYEQTYSEAGLAQSALWEAGTLCITIAANIAETAILGIDACFPDSVVGFVPDTQQADVLYVKYCLDTIKLKLQAASRGTTQDNLSLDKLRTFYICLPPIDILSKFNIETRDVIADSLLMVRANQNLRQTRGLLLPKLISGELDVEELDIAVAP